MASAAAVRVDALPHVNAAALLKGDGSDESSAFQTVVNTYPNGTRFQLGTATYNFRNVICPPNCAISGNGYNTVLLANSGQQMFKIANNLSKDWFRLDHLRFSITTTDCKYNTPIVDFIQARGVSIDHCNADVSGDHPCTLFRFSNSYFVSVTDGEYRMGRYGVFAVIEQAPINQTIDTFRFQGVSVIGPNAIIHRHAPNATQTTINSVIDTSHITVPPGPLIGIGMSITLSTGTANVETVTVTAVDHTVVNPIITFTPVTTKAHVAGEFVGVPQPAGGNSHNIILNGFRTGPTGTRVTNPDVDQELFTTSLNGLVTAGASSFTAVSPEQAARFAVGDPLMIGTRTTGDFTVWELLDVLSVVGSTVNVGVRDVEAQSVSVAASTFKNSYATNTPVVNQAISESTLNGSTALGATTIQVAAGTAWKFDIGDPIGIDFGGAYECRHITAFATQSNLRTVANAGDTTLHVTVGQGSRFSNGDLIRITNTAVVPRIREDFRITGISGDDLTVVSIYAAGSVGVQQATQYPTTTTVSRLTGSDVLTIDQGLDYTHANATQVVAHGVGISLATQDIFRVESSHIEGNAIGFLMGNGKAAVFDSNKNATSEYIRIMGTFSDFRLGAHDSQGQLFSGRSTLIKIPYTNANNIDFLDAPGPITLNATNWNPPVIIDGKNAGVNYTRRDVVRTYGASTVSLAPIRTITNAQAADVTTNQQRLRIIRSAGTDYWSEFYDGKRRWAIDQDNFTIWDGGTQSVKSGEFIINGTPENIQTFITTAAIVGASTIIVNDLTGIYPGTRLLLNNATTTEVVQVGSIKPTTANGGVVTLTGGNLTLAYAGGGTNTVLNNNSVGNAGTGGGVAALPGSICHNRNSSGVANAPPFFVKEVNATAVGWRPRNYVPGGNSSNRGQQIIVAPNDDLLPYTITTQAIVAGTAYLNYFWADRDYTIINGSIDVTTVGTGATDPCELVIYNSDMTNVIATSGSTATNFTSLGKKSYNVAAKLVYGQLYYVGFVAGTLTGAPAFLVTNYVTATWSSFLGATANKVAAATKAAQTIPLPSPMSGFAASANNPLIVLSEV